ncbi:MAG: N-acetylmuramoyl-L-alanine amidase [bacterium]
MRKYLAAPLLFLACLQLGFAAKLSPLAEAPNWSQLDKFQNTITREEFTRLLNNVYAPNGAAADFITITPNAARIRTSTGRPPYILKFAGASANPTPRFWRPRSDISTESGKPLAGLRIAIDPGHIGGKWAQMEERWFQIGKNKPVVEGDMTLRVAKLLRQRLKSLGAEVWLTRSGSEPLTKIRPAQLSKQAAASLHDKGESVTPRGVTEESERLFYRTGEIRRRATLVNNSIRPDIVLCLHFNAEDWGNPAKPSLVSKNHLHFLITGGWIAKELAYDDQRFEMLVKLLNRTYPEEVAVTKSLVKSMASATKLPPFIYHGKTAVRIGDNDYIWGRNLLANRLFQCPVVYVEPYVMNSRDVHARVQAGDYEGKKKVAGVVRPSIYREYADSVSTGLVDYYRQR